MSVAKDKPEKARMRREVREQFRSEVLEELELRGSSVGEAVSLYYDSQKLRIIHENKLRAKEGESELFEWFSEWLRVGEETLLRKLRAWVESEEAPEEARWAYEQSGIGPVLAAGLSAYIDVKKANSVSALWKYAGQAPGADRPVKGVKLPYNARLKTLCWKLGDSFVKVSGREGAVYGKLYGTFKEEEIQRNEGGKYKEAAARELTNKKFREDTVTRKRLEEGMLSDGHLHSRAKRRAIKIFLQHYWVVGREARGLEVSKPYVEAILGHQDIVKPVRLHPYVVVLDTKQMTSQPNGQIEPQIPSVGFGNYTYQDNSDILPKASSVPKAVEEKKNGTPKRKPRTKKEPVKGESERKPRM